MIRFDAVNWFQPSSPMQMSVQRTKDHIYTVSYRPPELCGAKTDLCETLSEKCDSWAFGFTLVEASTAKKFFGGKTQVDILMQINSYVSEMTVGVRGPLSKALKKAIELMPISLRKPVCDLVKSNPKNRASCPSLLKQVTKIWVTSASDKWPFCAIKFELIALSKLEKRRQCFSIGRIFGTVLMESFYQWSDLLLSVWSSHDSILILFRKCLKCSLIVSLSACTCCRSAWQQVLAIRAEVASLPEKLKATDDIVEALVGMTRLSREESIAYDFASALKKVAGVVDVLSTLQKSQMPDAAEPAQKLQEAVQKFEEWIEGTLCPDFNKQVLHVIQHTSATTLKSKNMSIGELAALTLGSTVKSFISALVYFLLQSAVSQPHVECWAVGYGHCKPIPINKYSMGLWVFCPCFHNLCHTPVITSEGLWCQSSTTTRSWTYVFHGLWLCFKKSFTVMASFWFFDLIFGPIACGVQTAV